MTAGYKKSKRQLQNIILEQEGIIAHADATGNTDKKKKCMKILTKAKKELAEYEEA